MSARIQDVLSVERVKAAYEATKLKPVRNTTVGWEDGRPACACAVGAVLVADGVAEQQRVNSGFAAHYLGVGPDDVARFMRGFDCVTKQTSPGAAVWEHGRAVARAVFGDAGGAA